MSVGRLVVIGVGGLILALIAGFVTRNVLIAILFPVLLIGFLLMWRNLKETNSLKKPSQEETTSKQTESVSQPPISTNYPPEETFN